MFERPKLVAMAPALSIVIPVYDNWWLTARCLRSLDALRGRCPLEFETIVVDNASTDETPQLHRGFSLGALPAARR